MNYVVEIKTKRKSPNEHTYVESHIETFEHYQSARTYAINHAYYPNDTIEIKIHKIVTEEIIIIERNH